MGKILILGEKREAMEDMAKHLGDKSIRKKNGYLEGDKYIVSWAMGHMYILEIPERLNEDYKLWNKLINKNDYIMKDMINVPLVPDNDPSRYDPKYQKNQYDFCKMKAKQLDTINSILDRKDIDEIIFAPDADAEGERIGQDLVFQQYVNKPHLKNIKKTRFWNTGSFKAETAITKAMNERKDINDPKYVNFYNSALARLLTDYLIGMKLTKTLSEKYNKMISSGRIQAVLLALLRKREDDIKNFKPKPYWTIKGLYGDLTLNHFFMEEDTNDKGNTIQIEKTAYMIKEDFQKVIDDCNNAKLTGIITKFDEKITKSQKPKLMSTGDFQSIYMDKFGGTLDMADMVLEYLREEGYTTYPRTDGHYFSIADKDEVQIAYQTINKVYNSINNGNDITDIQPFSTNISIFDDKKAAKQNHTPLSVTDKIPNDNTFNKWENAVYKKTHLKKVKESYFYILNTLAAQFLPDDKVKTQKIELDIAGHKFKKDGRKIIENGWRNILNSFYKDTTINFTDDKKLSKGTELTLDSLKNDELLTTKPPRFNKKTLLKLMINVNKALDEEIQSIEDPEIRKIRINEIQFIKKIFKEIEGIGTNATRKSILQILEKREVIDVKGKKEDIFVTELGYFVDDKNPSAVRSLDTTALWEVELDKIRRGDLDFMDFVKSVDHKIMNDMIPDILSQKDVNLSSNNSQKISLGKCPICKSGDIFNNAKSFSCSNWNLDDNPCKFTIWKNSLAKLGKKNISETEVKKFLKNNNVLEVQLIANNANKTKYKKNIILDIDRNSIKVDFDSNNSSQSSSKSLGKCPLCNNGDILEKQKAYGCSDWKNGCKYTIWKNSLDKFNAKLSKKIVLDIITKKKSSVKIKGELKDIVFDEKYGISVV
jgi:DNA topoisomerase-3